MMKIYVCVCVCLQEMYGEFIDELQNPTLLKPFDEIFELQLPLRNAKLKFHSKVCNRKKFLLFKFSKLSLLFISKYNISFGSTVATCLNQEYKEMSTKVRELYFKGNRVDNDTITGFQQLMTDVWFLYGINLNARIHANKTDGHTFFST